MGSDGTSPRTIIFIALISAASAIAVAFIGIVPKFYERKAPTPVPPKVCTISGEITSEEDRPLKNAEIYLIRATGSNIFATTDDEGKFTFPNLPDEDYWVIVRNTTSGSASRMLMSTEPSSGEIDVIKSKLHYKRCKK